MKRLRLLFVCAAVAVLACASAQASLTVTISDNGGDLTFDYAGSLDTTTLGPSTLLGGDAGSFNPSSGSLFGRILGSTLRYDNAIVSGPAFGSGIGDSFPISLVAPDAASGLTGFLFFPGAALRIDQTYLSGSAIVGSMTFGGHTIASQGITPGPHVYTIAGSTETITLQTVPLPAAAWLFGSIVALGVTTLRRR